MNSENHILVAPLNWGLGHATRCIPIIRALEANGFLPILASDGAALLMLQKEFPHLQSLELPSYEIEYAEHADDFTWKMLQNGPKMIEAILREKKIVKKWVKEYKLVGIISDNRLGVISKKVPSIFITHQLNVLSGITTWISSKLHQFIINKYEECWVPDEAEKPNFTGKLGHLKNPNAKIRYIGALSRFRKIEMPKKYDLMVILSGPEPQRGFLEAQLRTQLLDFNGTILFVCGIVEPEQIKEVSGHITFYNFMTSGELETAFNQSEKILCRSGYTTIMDLAILGKKAFFIPTPGQFEQEYLAKKLKNDGLVPYATQHDFRLPNLLEIDLFQGLPSPQNTMHWKNLFCIFDPK